MSPRIEDLKDNNGPSGGSVTYSSLASKLLFNATMLLIFKSASFAHSVLFRGDILI